MEFQSVIDLTKVMRGSAKFELSPYQATPSYIDLGAVSDLKVAEAIEMSKEEQDNALSINNTIIKQELTLECNMVQSLYMAALDTIRGGFDTKVVTPGTLVSGATQTLTGTSAGLGYQLQYVNANATQPTIATVIGNATTYTVNTDYRIVQIGTGWFIVFVTGGVYSPAHTIVITMSYTPAASVTYSSGDMMTLPFVSVRLTTKNAGLPFYFYGYKGVMTKGRTFDYKKDTDSDRRLITPVSLIFYNDPLYHPTANGNGSIYSTTGSYN